MKRALASFIAVLAFISLSAVAWAAMRTDEPPHAQARTARASAKQYPTSSYADFYRAQGVMDYLTATQVKDYLAAERGLVDAYLIANAPPPPVVQSKPYVAPALNVSTGWPTSLYPCGGDLPPCYVKQRESGGDYNARNPSSSASGAWQFLDSTWAGFGGYSSAYLAPPSVQDEKAREVWAGGAGCSHWSAC